MYRFPILLALGTGLLISALIIASLNSEAMTTPLGIAFILLAIACPFMYYAGKSFYK
ncbi:hypothetical protein LCGC14_0541490 [marine sediment metagenome]|uniref:Uncharacterized protein n=1 Tax=marine sediment metagenome TaxID=412755 RepID=A0A0F9RSV1_9ZZZZ